MTSLEEEQEEIEFLKRTKELSEQRNLPLEGVLNARDLASCCHGDNNNILQRGKIYRMGNVGNASEADIQLLMESLQIKTLIDLRSPTELRDDTTLMRPDVFGNFTNVVWKGRGRTKDGCVRVLQTEELPVKTRFWHKHQKKAEDLVDTMLTGQDASDDKNDCDECGSLKAMVASAYKKETQQQQRRERLFVPLMDEFKYIKGTVSKLRKRDILRAVLKSPGSIFSRRVRKSIKKYFLKEINDGGLPMLNELLFRYGAPGIRFVLEQCADESHHPIAFYCTAGKDRTGAISALIQTLCGVPTANIVEDYSLSANVYADLDDDNAMVGALSQRDLDPKIFLAASPQVMEESLADLKDHYGSVQDYCTWIGFDAQKQQQLRKVLLSTTPELK